MIILQNFLVGIILLISTNVIGRRVYKRWLNGVFLADPIIVQFLLGTIILTASYAIFKTSGITILLGLILIGFCLIFYSPQNNSIEKK